jgi:hypothetical protein
VPLRRTLYAPPSLSLVAPQASYLTRRLCSKVPRSSLDPAVKSRGTGRTALVPKLVLEPPGRVHLAAARRFNQRLETTEALDDVLSALSPDAPADGTDGASTAAAAASDPPPWLEVKTIPDGWTPLLHAVRSGGSGEVRTLLALGANPKARDRNGNTPLHTAAVAGACAKVQQLVDAGADLEAYNRYGRTALHEVRPHARACPQSRRPHDT